MSMYICYIGSYANRSTCACLQAVIICCHKLLDVVPSLLSENTAKSNHTGESEARSTNLRKSTWKILKVNFGILWLCCSEKVKSGLDIIMSWSNTPDTLQKLILLVIMCVHIMAYESWRRVPAAFNRAPLSLRWPWSPSMSSGCCTYARFSEKESGSQRSGKESQNMLKPRKTPRKLVKTLKNLKTP